MRLTLGINDNREQTSSQLTSIASLKFRPATPVDLVYVIESLGQADKLIGADAILDTMSGSSFFSLQKSIAEQALHYARQLAGELELDARTHLVSGQIANRLVQFTRENHADMLVLGSGDKTRLEGLMVGSVGRKAIVSSPASVLLSKGIGLPRQNLKVVLATDHSAYMTQCLSLLKQFAPQGIQEMIVASVYPTKGLQKFLGSTSPGKQKIEEELHRELEAGNQGVMKQLAPMGWNLSSRVEGGSVSDTLKAIMREEKADLLIVGAQGHGFVDRWAMGSVSLNMALTESKSVLVLRVPH